MRTLQERGWGRWSARGAERGLEISKVAWSLRSEFSYAGGSGVDAALGEQRKRAGGARVRGSKREDCWMDAEKAQTKVPWARWVLPACAVVAVAALLKEMVAASHWPLVHDAAVFQYIQFLMGKGFAPYREIPDLSMPGALILENLAMRAFGGGARGWFLWDETWVAVVVLGSAWIAGPGRRAAGVIAGSVTSLFHLSDGAWFVGQRDWVAAALLLLCCGCLFRILRGGRAAWWGGVAFFGVAATLVKPGGVFFCVIAVGVGAWIYRGSLRRLGTMMAWAAAGAAVPVAAVVIFLARWRALEAFAGTWRSLVPYYSTLMRISVPALLWPLLGRMGRLFVVIAACGLVLFALNRSWRSIGSVILLLGAGCGVLSYVLQDKGWAYHRYPAIAFAALWIALEAEKVLGGRGIRAWIAWPVLMSMAIALPCAVLARQRSTQYPAGTMEHLEYDLKRLGARDLTNRVQCLDETHTDCYSVLYRLNLVQPTGFIHEFLLFPKRATPVTDLLQTRFLEQVSARPPTVMILSEQDWPGGESGYKQVARWPAFASFLAQNYRLETQFDAGPRDLAGYRIYMLQSQRSPAAGPAR